MHSPLVAVTRWVSVCQFWDQGSAGHPVHAGTTVLQLRHGRVYDFGRLEQLYRAFQNVIEVDSQALVADLTDFDLVAILVFVPNLEARETSIPTG